MKLANFSKLIVSICVLVILSTGMLQAQEFMQPFTMDEQTVLLMHFDQNLINEATDSTANTTGSIADFGPPTGDFGNSMYIDNSGLGGSQIIVPHYDELNLDSSYTIEGWFLAVDNTIEGEDGYRGAYHRQCQIFGKVEPRNLHDDKDAGYDYGLRFVEADFTAFAYFGVGYYGIDVQGGQRNRLSDGIVQLNTWYHFAMVNDYANKTTAFLLFDSEGNLIEKSLDDNDPAIEEGYENYHNNEPLYIGTQDTHGEGNWFDGAVDEFRISNGIRADYEQYFTPVIGDVTANRFEDTDEKSSNATVGEEIPVEATVLQIGSYPVDNVELFYSTDGENFTSTDMTHTGSTEAGELFEGNIPAQSTAPSQVYYYVKASNANGTDYTPSAAETGEGYASIGVWERNQETYTLTFDDGTVDEVVDTLIDESEYNNQIFVEGENLEYSDDVPAALGDGKSVVMNMDPEKTDTTQWQTYGPCPFLQVYPLEGFTKTFWFKPENIVGQDKWQIQDGPVLRCRYADGDIRANFNLMHGDNIKFKKGVSNDSLEGKWWHYKAGATPDYVWWEMRDENDEIVWKYTEALGSGDTLQIFSDDDFGFPSEDRPERQFHGKIDDIHFYNYPHMIAPTILGSPSTENSMAGEAVDVSVEISHPGSEITAADLHYNVGSDWQTTSLSASGEKYYIASIPGQPAGTIADYYISVEADNGLSTVFPAKADVEENYLSAGWWEDSTMTLDLDFETNAPDGPPIDESDYGHEFIIHGADLVYSDDAMVGSYSLNFAGKSALEINPAPFITGSSFTVDTWIRPDSIYSSGSHDRICAKQNAKGDDKEGTFYIRFSSEEILRGHIDYIKPDGGVDDVRLEMDSTVTMGEWYHIIMAADVDTCMLQLRDANDELIQEIGDDIEYPIVTDAGRFVIGSDEIDFSNPYNGAIDGFKFYNYARMTPDTTGTGIGDDVRLPEKVTLSQNYPNPFNPTTKIKYTLPVQQKVTITIYDLLGRKVDVLINKDVKAGTHTAIWDGKNEHGSEISSGVYFYHMQTKNKQLVKKMILLR